MGSKLSTQHNMERNKKEDKADLHLTENQCVIYNKEGHTAPHTVSRLSEDAQYSGHLKIQKSGDLHKSLARCLKNPGYSHFIPVDTFTLKHLPEENNYEYDLYEYIKVTADLTVRVDAKATSQHRPEFWPETTKPYPFYNMSDRGTMRTGSQRRNLRTGSGKVCGVIKYHGRVTHDEDYRRIQHLKCWCKKCEDSDSPSNVWWEFDVDTATHVVFDDIEASQTTLRLFYDRYNSLEVIVDKVSVRFVSIELNWCALRCVTCEKNVGKKLMKMYKHFQNVNLKLWYKYGNSRQMFKFIVSHPYGCFKQVCVGQWKNKDKVNGRSSFIYTTCTCPLIDGADVMFLGLLKPYLA